MGASTMAELVASVNNGTLTVLDRPAFFSDFECALIHQGNAGDVNAAISLHAALCGDLWLWHLGYDNRAVLTKRDDPEVTITVISLNPGHALTLAVLQSALPQPLA